MINEIGVFIDKHHRVIRTGLYVISFSGLVVFIRSTHILKVYREIAAIPPKAIEHQHLLRGVVRSVHDDGSLLVAHQPMILRNLIKARDDETLKVRLAGVQPQNGFSDYLSRTVAGKRIRWSLLNQNPEVADVILYTPGSWFGRRSCVNEAVVREGVGVVTTNSADVIRADVYNALIRVLLAAEVGADRKGKKGIWKRPSKFQIWKDWIRSWYR